MSDADVLEILDSPEQSEAILEPLADADEVDNEETGEDAPPMDHENTPSGYPGSSPRADDSILSKSEEDGQTCPICFEPWSNSSEHRLVSLKCGHLFGHSCIDKWLRGQGSKCPQCNTAAKRSDIRQIFAKCLKVLDTTERDRALWDLEKERELRRRADLEAAQCRLQLQLARSELEQLMSEMKQLRQYSFTLEERLKLHNPEGVAPSQPNFSQTPAATQSRLKFELVKALEFPQNSSMRVLASSRLLSMLVASQRSTNPLFPGFGIKKIQLMDLKASEFVPIHTKAIKDIAFHPESNLILTASLDKTVKLTDSLSNISVHRCQLNADAWSCVWSGRCDSQFYVGLSSGAVLQFDSRQCREPLAETKVPGVISPVVALQYMSPSQVSPDFLGGPVVCHLSSCHLVSDSPGGETQIHTLPIEGNLTSANYEPHTGHLLVSSRPTPRQPRVSHLLFQLGPGKECRPVQACQGGTAQVQLAKSKLFLAGRTLMLGAGDETSRATLIWDSSRGSKVASLASKQGAILDILPFEEQDGSFLTTLSSNALNFYRWTCA